MGGADTEISDATTDVALEMAWFEPVGIAQTVVRTGLRTEASARFERGVDPYGRRRRHRPLRRAAGARRAPTSSCDAGAVDARSDDLPPAERATTVRVAAGQRGSSGRRSRPTRSPRCSSRSGSWRTRRRRRRRWTVDIPSWRPDSTRRDRRHRGGRPALRLRPHRQADADVDDPRSAVGAPAAPPAAAPGAARARDLRGHAQPVPRARRLRRAGLDGDVAAHRQPARRRRERAAHLAAARAAEGGRLQRVAPPSRRRAVRDRPRLPARAGRAARRVRGARRRARRARGAGGGGRVAGGRRGDGRRRPPRPGRRAGRACTRRARPRSSPAATRSAPSARSHPAVLEAFGDRRARRRARARPAPRARPRARSRRSGSRRAAIRRAISISRSCSPTTCRRSGWTRRSARAPARCWSAWSCSTCTAASGWGTGRAAWPTACACRRRTATSPTPTWPPCARRCPPPPAKLGAELRG